MTKNKDLGIIETHKNRSIIVTDSIVDSIVDKFINRAAFGKAKYNNDLDRNDLNVIEWINHFQEELMDGILYVEKLKNEIISEKWEHLK